MLWVAASYWSSSCSEIKPGHMGSSTFPDQFCLGPCETHGKVFPTICMEKLPQGFRWASAFPSYSSTQTFSRANTSSKPQIKLTSLLGCRHDSSFSCLGWVGVNDTCISRKGWRETRHFPSLSILEGYSLSCWGPVFLYDKQRWARDQKTWSEALVSSLPGSM